MPKQATLESRRERLKKLTEQIRFLYGECYAERRLPKEPGRYAVKEWNDRYQESDWETENTLEEVEEAILRGDVEHVVDLDTGEDVAFTVSVQINS